MENNNEQYEYVIFDYRGFHYKATTKKEALEKIDSKRKEHIEFYNERLEREKQDLEYFYKKEYDKMHILDQDYFLNRGEEGLKELEKATIDLIESFKNDIERFSSPNAFLLYKLETKR